MSNDSPTSLLNRVFRGALVLFGIAVLLQLTVWVIAAIWVWLVVIAAAMIGVLITLTALRRWWENSRW